MDLSILLAILPIPSGLIMNYFYPTKKFKYIWLIIYLLISATLYYSDNNSVKLSVFLLFISVLLYSYFFNRSKKWGAYSIWFSIIISSLCVAATSSDIVRVVLYPIVVCLLFIASTHTKYLEEPNSDDIDNIIPDINAKDIKQVNELLTMHRNNITKNRKMLRDNQTKITANSAQISDNETLSKKNESTLNITTGKVSSNDTKITQNIEDITKNKGDILQNKTNIVTNTGKIENFGSEAIKTDIYSWAKKNFVWVGNPPPDSDGYYIKTFNITDPHNKKYRSKTQLRVATSNGDRIPNKDNNDSLIVTNRQDTGFLGFQFLKQSKDSQDLPK